MDSYKDLEVWKKSRQLVSLVYLHTNSFPQNEFYGLTSQLRRCVISIPSNIAEGCGRRTAKNTIQFLYISRGSLYELETQLYLALDLNYIDKNNFNELQNELLTCRKLLS